MSRFELRISGVGSDRYTSWATTTAPFFQIVCVYNGNYFLQQIFFRTNRSRCFSSDQSSYLFTFHSEWRQTAFHENIISRSHIRKGKKWGEWKVEWRKRFWGEKWRSEWGGNSIRDKIRKQSLLSIGRSWLDEIAFDLFNDCMIQISKAPIPPLFLQHPYFLIFWPNLS